MKPIFKWTLRALTALAVIALALFIWKRDDITRLQAVNALFSDEKIVSNFSNMDKLFYHAPIPRGDGPVSELTIGRPIALPDAYESWVEARNITALVLLKDGLLRHEAYYLSTGPDDRRISWSVAKSFLSALLGTVIAEGKITSLQDPVTKYAPSLKGTAYDGATLEDVLQMESGVKFNEDYFDFRSDINRMGRVLALGQSMDGFAEGLTERSAKAGEAWHYVSIDTHIIGMVIRGATGRSITDLMSERIIAPLGLEAEPYYLTDGYGTAFVLGGLNLTTRDYARFGRMIAQNGLWNGTQIIPADWIARSTRPSANKPDGLQYGYQWWAPSDAEPGEFFGVGIYGQYLYINQRLGTVIAVNAADKGFRGDGVSAENIAMFRALAEAAQ